MVPLTMTVSPSIPGSAPSWVSSSSPSPSKDLSWTMSGRSSTPYSCGSSAFLLASSSTMNIPASPLYTWSSVCPRSEEHTSELQSRGHLVCRLLLEKKKVYTDQTEMARGGDCVLYRARQEISDCDDS